MRTGAPEIAHKIGVRSGIVISLFVLIFVVPACSEQRTIPGEGPPAGYIGGPIPDNYRGLRDPFALDDQLALEAGRRLHNINCAGCHGDNGRGDGPRSPRLEPRPADFAARPMLAAFRDHQDYVFWWVSDGVVQTSMPSFKERLSETERWQAITYAWYLGEQAIKK